MGLTDAARLEVIELVRRELERVLPLREVATKEDIKLIVETMNKRFEDVNKRFEDVNRRFEELYGSLRLYFIILGAMISLFTIVVSVLIALK